MRKSLVIVAALLALVTLYSFWSNSNIEAQRHRMRTLKKGMSRNEIEALLSKPNAVYPKAGQRACIDLSYTAPVMTITVCHDSATSAYFYEGKCEVAIFE